MPDVVSASAAPLGLIAGAGQFPHLVAEGARRAGRPLIVVALRDNAPDSLRAVARVFVPAGIVQLGRWIRILRRHGVREVVMAGRVDKTRMLALPLWRQLLAYRPDWTSFRLWFFKVRDRRNDTLLRAVADEMRVRGLELIDSTQYCPEALAPDGILAGRPPSPAEQADIDLGWKIAREMGRLDIGQSVAVKDKDIIAVEAIEGTDRMIRRAGELCRAGGWTLVKVSKPDQDMRFDVPTVGPDTMTQLAAGRARILVVEAGKTLMIDRDQMVASADKNGITIIGRRE